MPPIRRWCSGLLKVHAHDALVPKTIASIPELPEAAKAYGDCPKRPDRALTRPTLPETTDDRELDRLMAAWPGLPEHVRRAILILADNCH
jgi:hypothetical protein